MFELILTTLIFEKLRSLFKRKIKNNRNAIYKMRRNSPVFQTVGELRKILSNFSDDVHVEGGSFPYPNVQVREVNDIGRLYIGSQTYLPDESA